MSTHETMQGEMTFPTKAAFDAALAVFGEYIVDGVFQGEGGPFDNGPHVDAEALSITIPCGLYRNLSPLVDKVVGQTECIKCNIVGTTTDGKFVGWTIVDGRTTEVQLEDWWNAKPEAERSHVRPKPDSDDDLDRCIEWLLEVETAFHEEHAVE